MNIAPSVEITHSFFSCLPEYVIELIARMLVDERRNENATNENIGFIPCLQDVLNLRLTCNRVLRILNSACLKLECVLGSRLVLRERRSSLAQFLYFMENETTWKFSTVYIRIYSPIFLSEIDTLLQKHKVLFTDDAKLHLRVRVESELYEFGNRFQWLPPGAVKLSVDYSARFYENRPNRFLDPLLFDEIKFQLGSLI